jgi:hypothetical protein
MIFTKEITELGWDGQKLGGCNHKNIMLPKNLTHLDNSTRFTSNTLLLAFINPHGLYQNICAISFKN